MDFISLPNLASRAPIVDWCWLHLSACPEEPTLSEVAVEHHKFQTEGPPQYILFTNSWQIFDDLRSSPMTNAAAKLPFCPETDSWWSSSKFCMHHPRTHTLFACQTINKKDIKRPKFPKNAVIQIFSAKANEFPKDALQASGPSYQDPVVTPILETRLRSAAVALGIPPTSAWSCEDLAHLCSRQGRGKRDACHWKLAHAWYPTHPKVVHDVSIAIFGWRMVWLMYYIVVIST